MRKLITKEFIILLPLILLALLLRFFKLSDFPIQLNHDEVTQLYDAISVAETGRDIYGNFLPFIFPSIGDFKPPFYTYITGIFYIFFGGGELTIRLPAALFGTLMIPAIYLFVIKFLGDKKIAFFAAFFTAIAPFEIFFSRKGFESGTGVFLMLLGFSCLFIYLGRKKHLIWIYLAAVILAANMYIYFSHAIIIPLLLIAFFLIYRKHFMKNLIKFLVPSLLFISLILPLILLIIVNSDTRFRSQTVFITQDVNLGRQIGYVQTNNLLLDTILRYKITFDFIINRYLQQFNPVYLFGNGLDFINQSPIGVGPLLLIQLPFLILGIWYFFKSNHLNEQKKFIGVWISIGMLSSGLTFEQHSPHRSIMVFAMLNVISAAGLYVFINFVNDLNRNIRVKIVIFSIIIFAFAINIIYFIHMYFVNYPFEKSQYLQYPFKQVSQYVWSQYNNFNQIVFDPKFGDIAPEIGVGSHYYLAYYSNYPPAKFQKEYRLGDKPREIIFDKFSIREVYWQDDIHLKNTLLIVSPWSVPENDIKGKSKIIKRFYFYNGKLAFYAIKL